VRPFQDLIVWQKAHALTLEVYAVTKGFPAEERFGLTSQLRRSCSSIPANIAEGAARATRPEFRQFLNVAMGSAAETEYHLILARDLGYLVPSVQQALDSHLAEVKRMLAGLRARAGEGRTLKANSQELLAR
jgi:four helix bundle protein